MKYNQLKIKTVATDATDEKINEITEKLANEGHQIEKIIPHKTSIIIIYR